MTDLTATTLVTVQLKGRRATIEDVREALDILVTEGIPETFDISVSQREDREYQEGVAYADRPVEFSLTIQAERAAKNAGAR